jgi:hypothetical protein
MCFVNLYFLVLVLVVVYCFIKQEQEQGQGNITNKKAIKRVCLGLSCPVLSLYLSFFNIFILKLDFGYLPKILNKLIFELSCSCSCLKKRAKSQRSEDQLG